MKKTKKSLMYVLSLFIVLLFTPKIYSFLETIKEYPVTSLGVAAMAGVVSDQISEAVENSRQFQFESIKAERKVYLYSIQIQKRIEETKLKQVVKIEDLMKLISSTIVFGKYPVELFPTIESKVFVLDNIENFCDFNLLQYSNIQQIANEYKQEIDTPDLRKLEEKKVLYNWINKELKYFRAHYNISSRSLKNMTQEEVENKIKLIKRNLQEHIATNNINDPQVSFIDISESASCRALLTLLTHLMYKEANRKFAQQSEILPQSPNASQQSLFSQFLAWWKRFRQRYSNIVLQKPMQE